MTKAELESHAEQYMAIYQRAKQAYDQGDFTHAIEFATASWQHVDGMLQYKKRFQDQPEADVESILLLLLVAPVALDRSSLMSLETLLKDHKRIENSATKDLQSLMQNAAQLLSDAHRMWNYLEQHPGTNIHDVHAALGGRVQEWLHIADEWCRFGILNRAASSSSPLSFVTRLGAIVQGKCSKCGAISDGPYEMWLEPVNCSGCRTSANFVILAAVN